jgi:DNA integrity scanning protein DisA with diadenylate cyclase activity
VRVEAAEGGGAVEVDAEDVVAEGAVEEATEGEVVLGVGGRHVSFLSVSRSLCVSLYCVAALVHGTAGEERHDDRP